jgi:hypothetical protein
MLMFFYRQAYVTIAEQGEQAAAQGKLSTASYINKSACFPREIATSTATGSWRS